MFDRGQTFGWTGLVYFFGLRWACGCNGFSLGLGFGSLFKVRLVYLFNKDQSCNKCKLEGLVL